MRPPLNVVVTGSNRGIGKAICELILQKQSRLQPLKLFAASRKGEPLGLDDSDDVVCPKLDISRSDSIKALAEQMTQHGGVDVLINNAGVNLDADYNLETVETTLDVNYRGTLEMCQTFLPIISAKGRVVNMSSIASTLSPYSETIQGRFRDPDLTLEGLEQLAAEYEHSVDTRSEASAGFAGPKRAYGISKAFVNVFTRILASQHPQGPLINACCPGWVRTDMGALVSRKTAPPKTPEEGARVPYHLAFEDLDGVTGKYWANETVRGKGSGEVREW